MKLKTLKRDSTTPTDHGAIILLGGDFHKKENIWKNISSSWELWKRKVSLKIVGYLKPVKQQ